MPSYQAISSCGLSSSMRFISIHFTHHTMVVSKRASTLCLVQQHLTGEHSVLHLLTVSSLLLFCFSAGDEAGLATLAVRDGAATS